MRITLSNRALRLGAVILVALGMALMLASVGGAATLTIADTSISLTQARDGMTVTLGYKITASSTTAATLVASMTDPGGKVVADMGNDYNGTPYPITAGSGTNWYYRDFFINLPPAAQVGTGKLYSVKYTVNWGTSSTYSQTATNALTMLATVPVRVPILMYHKVQAISYSKYYIATADFKKQIAALKAYGYQTITYQQLMNYRAGLDTPPAKPIMLTFDDGYENYYTDVVPSADPLGYNTTCFVITGKVGGTNAWDTGDNNPVINHLTWPEIDQLNLDPLVDLESHTVNHPQLANVNSSTLKSELQNSRATLRSRLGTREMFFCYPYGSGASSSTVQQAVRDAGYFMAVAAGGGVEGNCNNKFDLYRVPIYSDTTTDYDAGPAGSFYFSEIGDSVVIPNLTVDSVQFLNPANNAPLSAAVWGQTVKVRVSAFNNGSAAGTGVSLLMTPVGYSTIYDSHATNPTQDPVVTAWTGQHYFDWLWTVPTDAPAGQYSATSYFRDQYFVLGWRKIITSDLWVQSNVLDLSSAKLANDGACNTFRGAIVTAAFPDCFYVETANRAVGIRVEKQAHGVTPGQTVDISGTFANSATTGERCISATFVTPKGTATIAPLIVATGAIGGAAFNHQDGVWHNKNSAWVSPTGLNNTGLLVKTCGKVVSVDAASRTLTIDDGSGSLKCVWQPGVSISPSWNYATLTGISSCENAAGQLHAVLLITAAAGS